LRKTLLSAVLALVLGVPGALLAIGPPRLTLLNAALRIDHPLQHGLGALLVCAGLVVLVVLVGRPWARFGLGALAAAALFVAADRLGYALEIDDAGLAASSLLGRSVVSWREVSRVETGAAAVVVWGGPERQIRVDTSAFRPEQRATLERAIARRVGAVDAAGPASAAAPADAAGRR
jgi:hypothetical protein